MKKLYFTCILSILTLISIGGVSNAYASEGLAETDEIVEVVEETELNEIEKQTSKITQWIISGVLGVFGTSVVAVAFRKGLKKLVESVKTALVDITDTKDKVNDDVNDLYKTAKNTIASLENTKEELIKLIDLKYEKFSIDNQTLLKAIIYIASGNSELVSNGTAETILNLVKEPNKEVIGNATKEV